jgi:ankyrin repeat protein
MTPLHRAAQDHHEKMAQFLIANGADVNAIDSQGRSPLDMAMEHPLSTTSELLREHSAVSGKELEQSEEE